MYLFPYVITLSIPGPQLIILTGGFFEAQYMHFGCEASIDINIRCIFCGSLCS
jgi:hypothetical protein